MTREGAGRIGEGEAFHRTSPDGGRGEKAVLHSPETMRFNAASKTTGKSAIVANHAIR